MIEEQEREVLHELDKNVPGYNQKHEKAHEALLIGLCIRRLSLYYRRTAKRYRQFGSSKSRPSFPLFLTDFYDRRARDTQEKCSGYVRHDGATLLSRLPYRAFSIPPRVDYV
jgi:hypothetical protein